MTWGSTVLNANTPYESFHHRHRRAVDPDQRAALPMWSSRSSRDMMRSSLELTDRAQTARSDSRRRRGRELERAGTAVSARRPRVATMPHAARNFRLAVSQSRSLGLHFPLAVTPPPTRPPRTPPAVFLGGSGFSRLLTAKLHTPLHGSSRRLGYTDIHWLLSLSGFEQLMKICGSRTAYPGVLLPSGIECKNIEPPAFVSAEEEKMLRRHIKWKKRTEESCATELRERLHEVIRPIYEKAIAAAVARANHAVTAANEALVSGHYQVEMLLTELDSAIRDTATPKDETMRDLYYHRALVLARSGRVEQALQDLNESLVSDSQDYRVLKAKYRLETVMETMEIPSMDYHGDHTREYNATNPGEAHDATAASLAMFLDAYPVKFGENLSSTVTDQDLIALGMDKEELERFRRTARGERSGLSQALSKIKRDRPYPSWTDRKPKQNLDRAATPEPAEIPKPPPSPWNECLDRVRDLLLDDVDDQRTRQMLVKHKEQLTEIFVFYCRIGSNTTGEKVDEDNPGQFSRIKAHQLRPSNMTPLAQERYCNLFWTNDIQNQKDLTAKAPIMPELPTTLITLRQFWRMGHDCNFVDGDCPLADIGRMFTFSCREEELANVEGFHRFPKGQDGYALRLRAAREQSEIDSVKELPELRDPVTQRWKQVGAHDVENPHHPNNRQHLFRFIETILRCAHRRLAAEKKNLANCFDAFLHEFIFPNACKHEGYDAVHWRYHSPKHQTLMLQYRAPLEKVYRYFSVPNPKAGVQTRDGKTMPLWKVRSASLLDNVFDFNELLGMFEKCGLFEIPMLPKPLGIIFETVTGQNGIAYQVHKNNNNNVMVLDEFYELMYRVAVACSNHEDYKGLNPEEVLEKYMADLFQKCTLVMPINQSVLLKAMGLPEGMEETILPREKEVTHSHLNEEAGGTDTMAVRRVPLFSIIDTEKLECKKRMADKVADRVAKEAKLDAEHAASLDLSLEEYMTTNEGVTGRVRAETPEGTPLNMWRYSPCGDGWWERADDHPEAPTKIGRSVHRSTGGRHLE